ncbi:hypothetical protein CI109_103782 [Kwoniella shandongensis]|uniref:TFIIS central domain-containing protein n=1 Tax=Kwoniella shandongensis TaxID=1734106 RepID=A0AAJ8LK65_9TREE
MTKGLRASLSESIINGSLTPSQVAVLTSADLASEEQLAAMERAKQAVLEQHVRAKEDVTTIRLGRDGFEKVEDTHEKEMKLLAAQEEAARVRRAEEARRESPVSEVPQSPVVPDVPRMTPKRSESIDVVGSPANQFAMKSAWGEEKADDAHEEAMFGAGGDQELDLSDIVQGDDVIDDLLEEKLLDESPGEMDIFEAKPVISNPADPSPHIPPMQLRLICRSSQSNWSLLLPHKTIEITGRVPTKTSLQFLGDTRLNPAKELITVAFSLDQKASQDEAKAWEALIEYLISRDRHAIYLPYGERPPQGAAKELYMIPLRPNDPAPDFTDLIDGFSLPAKGRPASLFLGVFIANRQSTSVSLPAPAQAPAPRAPLPAAAAAPTIESEKLKALMASLNPTMLQGLVGGSTPPQGSFTPIAGSSTPMPPPNFPPFPPPQLPHSSQGYSPYPPPPPADPYVSMSGSYSPHMGGPYQPPRQNGPPPPPPPSSSRQRGFDRERDNGWGSRGGDRRY